MKIVKFVAFYAHCLKDLSAFLSAPQRFRAWNGGAWQFRTVERHTHSPFSGHCTRETGAI